ncbi:MAG: 50S ribosomal protein L24, partial [Gammaproteobacteria bacterium]|nr:50S ribosomal protein L24 [Gammaproteobacteria bacterium]
VAIYNSGTKKADRVGYIIKDNGKKVRVFKSTGDQIDA